MDINVNNDFEEIRVKDVYIVNIFADPTPMVLLENMEGNLLPMFIGHLEALSIGNVLKNISPPRPMAHDLMINIFDRLGIKIECVMIDDKVEKYITLAFLSERIAMSCSSMQDQATALLLPSVQELL